MTATVTVRGAVDATLADRLVAFWTRHGALSEPDARARAGDVICVAFDGDEVVGTSSAYAAEVGMIAGLPFWLFRSFLLPEAAGAYREMVRRTFEALQAARRDESGPVGLCAIVPPDQARRHPEAVWSPLRMVYAGAADEGHHVRVAYFDAAPVRPREFPAADPWKWDLESGPRIEVFDEQDAVSAQDVVEAWVAGGAVDREKAERRVGDVLLVAIDDDGTFAGDTTVFLRDEPQLRTPMWHARTWVAPAHRQRTTGLRLTIRRHQVLGERYASGRDTRAPGVLMVLENPGLRRAFPEAYWPPMDATFIAVNGRGDDVRVHWFPGATVPV